MGWPLTVRAPSQGSLSANKQREAEAYDARQADDQQRRPEAAPEGQRPGVCDQSDAAGDQRDDVQQRQLAGRGCDAGTPAGGQQIERRQ